MLLLVLIPKAYVCVPAIEVAVVIAPFVAAVPHTHGDDPLFVQLSELSIRRSPHTRGIIGLRKYLRGPIDFHI